MIEDHQLEQLEVALLATDNRKLIEKITEIKSLMIQAAEYSSATLIESQARQYYPLYDLIDKVLLSKRVEHKNIYPDLYEFHAYIQGKNRELRNHEINNLYKETIEIIRGRYTGTQEPVSVTVQPLPIPPVHTAVGNAVATGTTEISPRISSITLKNFRAFYGDDDRNTFKIDGKNCLVYGENGSGKSSLYWALKLFVDSSRKSSIKNHFDEEHPLDSLKNIFSSPEADYAIKVTFDRQIGNDESLVISNDDFETETKEFIRECSTCKPFLDYKKLLRAYMHDEPGSGEKNLFSFFQKLLKHYPITSSEGQKLFELSPDEQYVALRDILSELTPIVQEILAIFDDTFLLDRFGFDNTGKRILAVTHYHGRQIMRHHLFLNEAKLSALAVSVYFASILKIAELMRSDSLRILVLDDLLIGLDMGNRLPLLEVLKTFFSNFQIFILTYDRAWFEVVKSHVKTSDWVSFEMYSEQKEDMEYPVIKPSLDYYEKAQEYFSVHDYGACANYLRKEYERLKKIKEKQEANVPTGERAVHILKSLCRSKDFENFKDPSLTDVSTIGHIRGKLIGIESNIINAREPSLENDISNMQSILQRILHPYSHDDTSRPLYKRELEEALERVEELRQVIEGTE